MGCDIHSVIQVRRVSEPLEESSWKTIEEGLEERNYQVFGILADVRSHRKCKTISVPRGFPNDFIYEVHKGDANSRYHQMNDKKFYMGDNSFSYLTAKELLKYKWDRVPWEYDFPPDLQRLLHRLKKLADEYGDENVRMVFGFDS